MKTPSPIRRAFYVLSYYAQGVFRGFVRKDVFLWSGAIAFKVLITLVPLVLLVAGIFGLVLRRAAIRETIENFITAFAPETQSGQISDLLLGFSSKGDTITLIGAVVLFLTVVTLFTTLRKVVGNIFEGTHGNRGILRGYALDVVLAVLGGVLFLLTFGSSLLMDVFEAFSTDLIAHLGENRQWLETLWSSFGNSIELLFPLILSTILFFGLYALIPYPHPARRSALMGALTTAILWELAKRTFSFYIVEFGTFDRYSGIGTLGLIVGLVFWTYYSGLVFIIGAMVTALHDERSSPRRHEPTTGHRSHGELPPWPDNRGKERKEGEEGKGGEEGEEGKEGKEGDSAPVPASSDS